MRPFDPDRRNLVRFPLDDENLLSGQFWDTLRVFPAVAKAKSFTRAAEVLNIGQPPSGAKADASASCGTVD